MSNVLRTLAQELETLTRSRNYLADLIRCEKARAACQPQHPDLACDKQLLGRLDACHVCLVSEQAQLVASRTELLREARAKSQFSIPRDMQQRIDTYDTLLKYANSRNQQGLQSISRHCNVSPFLNQQLKARIQKLATIDRRTLEATAQKHADALAYPHTKFWHSSRDDYLRAYANDWKWLIGTITSALESTHIERRELATRHDEAIISKVELLLALPSTTVEVTSLTTEVNVIREREASTQEAVKRVWIGTQQVKGWVYRDAIEPLETDRSLAKLWASNPGDGSYWNAAMESARCAEVVALALYRDLFGQSEDLSLLQLLSPADTRWKTADIATSERMVDVKNARRSLSSQIAYSEHTVKRFKSDHLSQDVVVSGFLSPYCANAGFAPGEPVVWLGETTLGAIDRLRLDFESDYLHIGLTLNQLTLIPPWLFEYPQQCYAGRDSALSTIRSDGFVLPRSDCPLALLVVTGRLAASKSHDAVSQEALLLSQRFTTSTILTRPALFLHILDRFCQCVRNGLPFSADALREILFAGDSTILAGLSGNSTPLSLLDPLEVVYTFLDVLEKVSETCAEQAAAYSTFKLAGPSVLQGRHGTGPWQTLFAYCGGWGKLQSGGPVKCRQNPIYLGQDVRCDVCDRLICHKCGFCKKSCTECAPRQNGWPCISLQ